MTSRDSLTSQLADLHEPAPSGLLANVLTATGTGIRYTTVDGPIGKVVVFFNDNAVTGCSAVEYVDEYIDSFEVPPVAVERLPRRLAGRVKRALSTGRIGDLPIDLSRLSPFQQAVLRATATIPPGEVRPYGWIAREIGKPGAVRAVGSALNKNPVPILIPCHRVAKSDGHIGNYAHGPAMKRALLEAEGLDPDDIDALADRNIRYTGSDTTKIFCHPSCRHARRTTEQHTVEFRTETAARSAGYRPCMVCRPAAA